MRGVGVEKDIMERIKPQILQVTSVWKVTSWPLETNTEMVNEASEFPSIQHICEHEILRSKSDVIFCGITTLKEKSVWNKVTEWPNPAVQSRWSWEARPAWVSTTRWPVLMGWDRLPPVQGVWQWANSSHLYCARIDFTHCLIFLGP